MTLFSASQDSSYTQVLLASPLLSLLLIFSLSCVITRVSTGVQYAIAQSNRNLKKLPGRVPYWIPGLGSAVRVALGLNQSLSHDGAISNDGVISYRIGARQFYVLTMPSLIQQVYAQRKDALHKRRIHQWLMRAVLDDKNSTTNEPIASHRYHDVIDLMRKDSFISNTLTTITSTIQYQAAGLVKENGKSQTLWEQAARVESNIDGTFQADFHKLIVYFVGQLTIDAIMGKALLKNSPKLLQDLFEFGDGPNFLLPQCLQKMTAKGRHVINARTQIGAALKEWYLAVAAKQAGQDPGKSWNDLDDVSSIMQDAIQSFVDNKASEALKTSSMIGIIRSATGNISNFSFWMLLQIYARPDLLEQIREEIAPYVYPSPTEERGLDGSLKLEIDVEGLSTKCPLIKATSFETLRMNSGIIGGRDVDKEITLKESPLDATRLGKQSPQSYTIPAGVSLVLALPTMQKDPRIFEDPESFAPERFIQEGPDGTRRAVMSGGLNVFGGGVYNCKGRTFAEKYMLVATSCLLVMWDIKLPDGKMPASAAEAHTVRVEMTRRLQ